MSRVSGGCSGCHESKARVRSMRRPAGQSLSTWPELGDSNRRTGIRGEPVTRSWSRSIEKKICPSCCECPVSASPAVRAAGACGLPFQGSSPRRRLSAPLGQWSKCSNRKQSATSWRAEAGSWFAYTRMAGRPVDRPRKGQIANGSAGELDAVCAWAFLARLDLEADALASGERVEVNAWVEARAVKEIFAPVLRRDEPKPAVGDQLLDCACRHRDTPLLERKCRERSGPFEKNRRPRRTSTDIRRRNYLTTGPTTLQSANSATPNNVATAPDSLSAAALRSRSFHTPQTATATTAVSRTGATTANGAMLSASKTMR